MTEIVGFDSPLTRLKRDYEEKLAGKQFELDDALRMVQIANEEVARVKGTRDLLKLLLADMSGQVAGLVDAVTLMQRNITELRAKLGRS